MSQRIIKLDIKPAFNLINKDEAFYYPMIECETGMQPLYDNLGIIFFTSYSDAKHYLETKYLVINDNVKAKILYTDMIERYL